MQQLTIDTALLSNCFACLYFTINFFNCAHAILLSTSYCTMKSQLLVNARVHACIRNREYQEFTMYVKL